MIPSIVIPDHLQRNAPFVLDAGVEYGGEKLLRLLARRIGRIDLTGLDLLDVGCGVRFTQTLINRRLPFGSYTGLEVDAAIVQWLQAHVSARDARFQFVHWDAHNAYYNQGESARPMRSFASFPLTGTYDVVTGFSLFTHLSPSDAEQMLLFMRKATRAGGYLLFSAFCRDKSVSTYREAKPDEPSAEVHYACSYLEDLLTQTGWEKISYEEREASGTGFRAGLDPVPRYFIADAFLCRATAVPCDQGHAK